jgi:hypothetical protein
VESNGRVKGKGIGRGAEGNWKRKGKGKEGMEGVRGC